MVPGHGLKNSPRAFLAPILPYGQTEATDFFILKRNLLGSDAYEIVATAHHNCPSPAFLPIFPFFLFLYSLCFVLLFKCTDCQRRDRAQ